MPAGSSPLAGSSSINQCGILEQRRRQAEPLTHAQRVLPHQRRPHARPGRPAPACRRPRGGRCRRVRAEQPRFSRPVMVGNIAGVSTMAPMRRHRLRQTAGTGAPSIAARPAVGRTRPSRQRIVVVLPEPFGPRKPYTPPSGTDRSSPSTATRLLFRAPVLLAESGDLYGCAHWRDRRGQRVRWVTRATSAPVIRGGRSMLPRRPPRAATRR